VPISSASATDGVWVSLNSGNGTFQAPQLVVGNFGYIAGGWRVDRHPRFLADVTADGRAALVGFGDPGVWVSRNSGNATFQPLQLVIGNFGYDAGGWRVERHPRFLADLTGDGRADIVGFGNAGVWVWFSSQIPDHMRRTQRTPKVSVVQRDS
jgi:hypothetical protein